MTTLDMQKFIEQNADIVEKVRKSTEKANEVKVGFENAKKMLNNLTESITGKPGNGKQ